ncbi:hypothetical protein DZC30_17275 [Comamonas testosteroni]|uniref:Uncharacterized protein n=1 Tax=Comamonas testosteroni TaxID=285 RepID=A0A373FE04_COMTE|nr:hypothetical protein DZC30_17275 [Comamonas testosteroni]
MEGSVDPIYHSVRRPHLRQLKSAPFTQKFGHARATKWEISCCWCDGLWKPSCMNLADVNDWATDTALQVMEYVQLLKGMLNAHTLGTAT